MKTVFFDVDTQLDFMYPAGALYVPGAEKLIPRIRGASYKALSFALTLVDEVESELQGKNPRMADFVIWAEAFCWSRCWCFCFASISIARRAPAWWHSCCPPGFWPSLITIKPAMWTGARVCC